MYSFNYQKVKTVADAAKMLAKDGDAKLLAGGQSLIAAMKLRLAHPSAVIDLGAIKELSALKPDSKPLAVGAVGVFGGASGAGVRVAVPAAGPRVFRVAAMERARAAKFAPESVANIAVPEKGLNADLHAKADYRAHLITVMAKRAGEAAMK